MKIIGNNFEIDENLKIFGNIPSLMIEEMKNPLIIQTGREIEKDRWIEEIKKVYKTDKKEYLKELYGIIKYKLMIQCKLS